MEISKVPDNISGKSIPIPQLSIPIQSNCSTNGDLRSTFCIHIDDQRLAPIKIHRLKPFFCQICGFYGNNRSLLFAIYHNAVLIYNCFRIISRIISGERIQRALNINGKSAVISIILLRNILNLSARSNKRIITAVREFYIPFSLVSVSIGSYPDICAISKHNFRIAALCCSYRQRLTRIFEINNPAAVSVNIQNILVRCGIYLFSCHLSYCDISLNMVNRSVKFIRENCKILKGKYRFLSIIAGRTSKRSRCWIGK